MTPAGKATRRLSLLSGGEKALVALAFVFAVFLARPSPFYILDEVEAALDDANIDRFLQLVRRFSDRAQFVIVTHQKRTMDAADVLYGVSMGKGGITKVISAAASHTADEAAARPPRPPEAALSRARRWRQELARAFDLGERGDDRRRATGDAPQIGRPSPSRRAACFGACARASQEPRGAPGRARREPLRPARRRDLGAARGGTDPRRRRSPDDGRGGRPLEDEVDGGRLSGADAVANASSSCSPRSQAAARRPAGPERTPRGDHGRRRQRHRQDDHDRQARRAPARELG